MCAVYAFARRVDDIGDGTLAARAEAAPARTRSCSARRLAALVRRPPPAPTGERRRGPRDGRAGGRLVRFPLPPAALGELIEGVRMDVAGTTYESFDELVVYCRRVAGAIGRACLAIFGLRDSAGADARAGRIASPTTSAWRCSSRTSCATCARTRRTAACTCPPRIYGASLSSARRARRCRSPWGASASPRASPRRSAARAGAGERARGPVRRVRRDRRARARGAGGARALRVRARTRVVRPRARAGGDARPAQRRVRAGDGRHLPPPARAHRRRTPSEIARRRVSLPAREKAWVAARGLLGGGA